jgi:phosphate uptake regulator
MNRILKGNVEETPSQLMGTIAIMGFAAEDNLRNVAQALSKRDLTGLGRVVERNAKQSRLRAEIENQIVEEMARPTVGIRQRRKLVLASQVALMFERMGAQTIEISQLCGQVISEPKPSRVTELKKLIEHAVYITDRAATGLVEEDLEMATIASEQKRAATELNARINRDLASQVDARGDAAVRADLLCRIACEAHGIIEEAGRLAQDVIAFLEKPEIQRSASSRALH